MYKLTYSPASPYVRKVMLAAYSIKINHEIDLVSSENKFFQDFKSKNPLSKIPILMTPNGDYLFDSRVIIDYFNRLEGSLIPLEGKERDIVMTKCALTEGIIDAALLFVYSNRYAGDSKPSKIWQELQISKIKHSLMSLNLNVSNWEILSKVNASHIGLIVALDYLNFRNIFNWEKDMKHLLEWHEKSKLVVPGYVETLPKD